MLSLSATPQAPPYMIDPRFPLFQQALESPKKSHTALAELLGDSELIAHGVDPTPDSFPDSRIAWIAQKWVEFNIGYGANEGQSFDKYARRLKEAIEPERAQDPEAVLAPYFSCDGPNDPWWSRSVEFFEQTKAAAGATSCLRVVCATSANALDALLRSIDADEKVVVWVSNFDEHKATAENLRTYREAIGHSAGRGQDTFALYGGFFSVLLGIDGLCGASHGVGYSEHRNWRELPSAGAPPARYYLRRAHRYVAQDLAQVLYEISPDLTQCPCPHCDQRPPIELDYHELMKHSVLCRAEEIERWVSLDAETAARLLEDEHAALSTQIEGATLVPRIRKRAESSIEHMPQWTAALRAP